MVIGFSANGDNDIERCFQKIAAELLLKPVIDTGHWQSVRNVPQTKTYEIQHAIIEIPIAATKGAWASFMKPNLPWADEHFAERVGGKALNPPPSHVNWPFAQGGNAEFTDDDEEFSHSYPERMWPRDAFGSGLGLKYRLGDLNNAVDLLLQEPHTRQCYIAIWYPEDLHAAAVEQARVPCTLGYHMMLRRDKLHVFYPMRSLDLLRYFQDDAYMAGRLGQWLIHECEKREPGGMWKHVTPGNLTMFASSLHIFQDDVPILRHKYGVNV
jgi:thymidylate synthase